ncbi:MAG: hypothetical protein AAFO88_02540, partial [Pseudomonadota bacterium]
MNNSTGRQLYHSSRAEGFPIYRNNRERITVGVKVGFVISKQRQSLGATIFIEVVRAIAIGKCLV